MVSFSSASASEDQVESEFEAFKAELKLLKELKAGNGAAGNGSQKNAPKRDLRPNERAERV